MKALTETLNEILENTLNWGIAKIIDDKQW